jgi:hypothetical protein
MSLGSDPIDQAFPQTGENPAPLVGDPIDHAFADHPDSSKPAQTILQKFGHGLDKALTNTPVPVLENMVSGITGGVGSLLDTVTGADPGTHDTAYQPRTTRGKQIQSAVNSVAGTGIKALSKGIANTGLDTEDIAGSAQNALEDTLNERIPQAIGAVGTLAGVGGLVSKVAGRMAPKSQVPAQEVANLTAAQQSGGAAGAAPNLETASAPLKSAISEASRKTGGAVNPEALQNHLEADSHGIQLTKGQATRDPTQFSNEQNSTHSDLVNRLGSQNGQMVDAIDTIRREASPTTVSNSPRENGQVTLDDLKTYDEPIRADIKAKYQKLADANGGAIPIDTGSTISSIDARLKKGSLTRTATTDPAVSEVMDNLRSGNPMDFESFESARSLLAGVQRRGGPAGVAAGIARDELEKMPLPPEAAPLKVLADDARSAAAARFNELKRDPAYEAAVDDVTNGNAKGKPSPLSDTFLDDYALNRGAPKQQVDLMMGKLSDEGKGAVASHTLGAIRKGAVNASGNVLPNGYNSAMAKYGDKLPSLVSPETNDSLQSLGRVITNAKVAPAGSFVNYSKSGVISNAAHGLGEAALGHIPIAKHGIPIVKGMMESRFAKDATAPGAGLDQLKTKP